MNDARTMTVGEGTGQGIGDASPRGGCEPSVRPSAHVVISVKMRREEAEAFRAACQTLGVRPNKAFRALARGVGGYLEADPAILGQLRAFVRQVSGIATNVNQIARAGNTTRRPDYRAFLRERRSLGGQLARVEDLVRRILDADARRIEGRRRLSRALAEFDRRDP